MQKIDAIVCYIDTSVTIYCMCNWCTPDLEADAVAAGRHEGRYRHDVMGIDSDILPTAMNTSRSHITVISHPQHAAQAVNLN